MQELMGGKTATQAGLPSAENLISLCSSDIPAYVGMPVYAPLSSTNQLVVDYVAGQTKGPSIYEKVVVKDTVTGDVQVFSRINLRDGVLMVWPEEAIAERERLASLRGIEEITAEIKHCKQQTVQSIVRIGQCLTEAKELLAHGQWLAWLEVSVEFSADTAQRLMKIAEQFANTAPVRNLNYTKLLALLAIPVDDREGFLASTHEVEGQQKTVDEMSKRELQQVIKERNEANKRAASAEERIAQSCAKAVRAESEATRACAEAAELKKQLEEMATRPAADTAEPAPERLAEIRAEEYRRASEKFEASRCEYESKRQLAEAELCRQLELAQASSQEDVQPFPRTMLEQAVSAFTSGIDSAIDHFVLLANCMEPVVAVEKTQECLCYFDIMRDRLECLLGKAKDALSQGDDLDLPELD